MSVASEKIVHPIEVRKRDGSLVAFDAERIERAIGKAFRADREIPEPQQLDKFSTLEVREVTSTVTRRIMQGLKSEINIEEIQDLVEIVLMQRGHYTVAKRYIVYREERAKNRLNSLG